jgi:heterotetrameric sarcosine oxidase gamma subunit
VAEMRLRHPLDGVARPGTTGMVPADGPGIVLTDRRGLALCQLMARKGQAARLAELFGIAGQPGRATVTERFTACPLSPGQWLLIASDGRDGAFARAMAERAAGLGYVSEQSHGRQAIRVAGRRARELMAKGCRLDLHPRVSAPAFCAQTQMAQIGVTILQVDDRPTYDLFVFAGFAEAFWHWLTEAAAEYGCEVRIG